MLGPVLVIVLGVVVLVDVLRVFLPSLITVFGSAGSTPAELIGLYALAWFVAAFLAVLVARFTGPRVVALVAAALLAATRLGLQFTDGGSAQLYLASVGVFGGLSWLVAVAMAPPRRFLLGLAWGLGVAAGAHAALDTVDLVWRDGPVWVALAAIEAAAFALLAVRAYRTSGEEEEAAPRAYLIVGPALLLWGLYPGSTAHAQASAGWSPLAAAAAVAAAGFLAVMLTARPRWTIQPVLPGVLLIASAVAFAFGAATVDGVHGVAPWWTVVAQVVGVLALGACLGWVSLTRTATSRPSRRGLLLASGFMIFIVFAFAYYAAYDLGVPNDYAPIALAAVVAVLAVTGAGSVAPAAGGRTGLIGVQVLAGAAAAVLAIAAVPLWRPAPLQWAASPDGLRLVSYNIRMGYGLAGTFTVPEQAAAIAALRPDVVLLSEVDRAWFLNGGHDDLRLIAERLDMRYVWAPAADEVWGDALLTKLPVTSVRNHVLVQGGPTGAQALEVGLRWNNRDITVIATHLQPPSNWEPLDQVEQLADIARAAKKPTIVAGDLNLEPGEPAWEVLTAAGLTDAFASARPFNTMPSPHRAEQIDHILFTTGFRAVDPANPDIDISDHRPVAVTLIPS